MHMDVLKVRVKLFFCPPLRHIGEWRYCCTHS